MWNTQRETLLGSVNQTSITSLVLALAIAAFAGCSPVSEGLVKKTQAMRYSDVNRSPYSSEAVSEVFSLPQADKVILQSYGGTIKKYAKEYGLDWRFVLAVMKVESKFIHDVESPKGASGLMQIMPVTSVEVAKNLGIEDMAHPMNNIRGGVYYFSKLYSLFDGAEDSDRLKLALAAYNAGIGRVYDAQMVAAYLHDNPRKWESVRTALPLLSKRYYTLHKNIWDEGRPKIAGWFGSSKETLTYVDRVMEWYESYRQALN